MLRDCDQCGKEMKVKESRSNQKVSLCSQVCVKAWHSVEARLRRSYEVNQKTGCWEFIGGLRNGYGAIKNGGKTDGAHRVSYEIHKGEISQGLFVCHTCDNRKCVNPEHLWLGTAKDNMQDCAKKGRIVTSREAFFKERHIPYNATLSGEEVLEIRSMVKTGIKPSEIAQIVGTSRHKVNDIIRGKSYKHIHP